MFYTEEEDEGEFWSWFTYMNKVRSNRLTIIDTIKSRTSNIIIEKIKRYMDGQINCIIKKRPMKYKDVYEIKMIGDDTSVSRIGPIPSRYKHIFEHVVRIVEKNRNIGTYRQLDANEIIGKDIETIYWLINYRYQQEIDDISSYEERIDEYLQHKDEYKDEIEYYEKYIKGKEIPKIKYQELADKYKWYSEDIYNYAHTIEYNYYDELGGKHDVDVEVISLFKTKN